MEHSLERDRRTPVRSRRHHCFDAAADRKVADDRHPARLEGRDEIVKDLVGDVLVKDAAVSELDHVVLERFQLDAPRVRDVRDADLAEIGKARFRTKRRELRAIDGDLVIALGPRVGKRLERRA